MNTLLLLAALRCQLANDPEFSTSMQTKALEATVRIVHPASIPVERRGRRVKTDRIDLDMLLRTFLAWLRGEPRVCSMVRIPSEAEEEMRRPGRERERLVGERIQLENRIENLLCLHGVVGFRPRLKKAAERLDELRSFAGTPLPAKTMAELRRLMARHRLLAEQLQEIEAERDRVATATHPDRAERMIRHLAQIVGLGLETATVLVREMLCRPFRDRRAVAGFAGLTGTPFRSGGHRARAGDRQERQCARPPHRGAARLALAALPAAERARAVVCRAHRRRQRTHPHGHDCGSCPQAAGRPLFGARGRPGALCRDR